MVGLVIVSHSAKLADGVAELMRGVAGPDAQIATAGGLDMPERPLGTDANLIANAIQQVYSADGVVVLVDLGSAILSTEMALETFTPEQRARIRLAPAPLVEGGIAAAVQARLGSDLDSVLHEAQTALAGKLVQLGADAGVAPADQAHPPAGESQTEPAQTLTLSVNNLLGLHARPAARFVQTAARFAAQVQLRDLTSGRGPANAKSINAVTTLGVTHGHTIEIRASGPDAALALSALQELAGENFGDSETPERQPQVITATRPPPVPVNASGQNELYGRAASPGAAIGTARRVEPVTPAIPQNTVADPAHEWARVQAAIQKTEAQLQATRAALRARGNGDEAGIFDAQVLMLEDEALQEPVRRAIFDQKLNGALAFDRAARTIADQYAALDDEYLRARAADVRAIAQQVLMHLLGISPVTFKKAGIIVAPDLTPAETAALDPSQVQAICTAFGGPTGHSAILAKTLGIPAVVGLGERLLSIREEDTLIVDGDQGRVWVNPDPELLVEYKLLIEQRRAAAEALRRTRYEPALTRDGRRIEIAANIGSLRDAEQAVELGAEAVGLFRTEFLFLARRQAPTEEEQYTTYRAVAQMLAGRALLIRTLDIGGDKPLPYAEMPHEANPFLGQRGLRLSLAQPEMFKTQLRAILRVAAEFPTLRVMFPMVSTVQEFRDAVGLIIQAHDELVAHSVPTAERIETGIMVEVPSAALAAAHFASEVDFFSIGTNDLTQYTLAAERGNAQVAALTDSFHPAVLQLIANVVNAAHARNKWVGVCGEMGGDPHAIPLLVGLGVDELSMSPPLIPAAKQLVRELDFAEAQTQARKRLE